MCTRESERDWLAADPLICYAGIGTSYGSFAEIAGQNWYESPGAYGGGKYFGAEECAFDFTVTVVPKIELSKESSSATKNIVSLVVAALAPIISCVNAL